MSFICAQGTDRAYHDSFIVFFKKLFHADFMPHGSCYFWRPDIVWLNVISDGVIALSYYAIPIILLVFMIRRKDFPFPWVLFMFGAFILLCGTTHLMSIVTLWDPVYRLDGLIKAATAIVSIFTTLLLIPLVPLALALRSPKELEAANLKLAEANDKLKEIDRLKDNFFSNISHELRTPLTLILAPLESLLAKDYGSLGDPQVKTLEAMHNNTIRLFQMVNSILDFAKISAKKIEVNREPLDIVLLTNTITHEFTPIVKQKHIQIHFSSDDKTKIVSIDRYLYERILFNLLTNATKFTLENGSIDVRLECRDDKTIITVKDSGIGISEENQKKLFQRFQQIEGSATRRFEGTGLGLALVKEFSVILGGDVSVESEVNKGSTFTVELATPFVESKEEINAKPLEGRFQRFEILPTQSIEVPTETAKPHVESKILIAEDNIELGSYMVSLLSGIAQVKHVKDGEAAWETIQVWEPNLVLLDVMMPKKDGITLCREIKSFPKTSHIPVVLVTALTHRDALIRGWEAGADEYLFKPFHPKELVTRIKLLLNHARNALLVKELSQKLIVAARLVGMSEVASGILHSVGNILNSINVTANLLLEKLSKSPTLHLDKLNEWVKNWMADRNAFITDTQKKDDFILYLKTLQEYLVTENKELTDDVKSLNKHIRFIAEILSAQRREEGLSGVVENVVIKNLLEDTIKIVFVDVANIQIKEDYDDVSQILVDKVRLQDILVNLLRNAKDSLHASHKPVKEISISAKQIKLNDHDGIEISITDNGSGIIPEDLAKIFTFGFTTKKLGFGIGLHFSLLSVQKMGGELIANSPGKDQGATFVLRLPVEPLDTKNWVMATS